jgi:outer membrane protein assembly factor BamB
MSTQVRSVLRGMAVIAMAACTGSSLEPKGQPLIQSPTAARDTISVVLWRRTGLSFPYSVSASANVPTSGILTVTGNGLTSINPATGSALWTATFSTAPREIRSRGTIVKLQYGPYGDGELEAFLDEATGTVLWTQLTSAVRRGRLLAASSTTILEVIGDAEFIARERSTGSIRWVRKVALSACTIGSDDCLLVAGYRQSPFVLVSPVILGGPQHFIRLTDAGDVTLTPFNDPAAGAFTIVDNVTADSAGTRVVMTTRFSAFAIDGATGSLRWAIRHPFFLDNSLLEEPIVRVVTGPTPLVDLFYQYSTPTATAFAREVVRDLTNGTIVRESVRKERADQIAYIGPCGDDGIVIVRTTGRFLFSNLRTGVDTEGIIRDPATNGITSISALVSEVRTFASGYLALQTLNDGMIGFRCHP